MNALSIEETLNRYGMICSPNHGVSMQPFLQQGRDMMVIRKCTAPCRKYDAVLYRRTHSDHTDYVLHRILRVRPDGSYWIVGDQPTGGESVQAGDVLGVLVAVIRNGKQLDVNTLAYRLRVRLWYGCILPIRRLYGHPAKR